ncbi:MAG: hypothetical protein LBG61_00580 [Burkholderiales bacterium]|jgi:hypothetical protein|nr:hypothetical protein [Burkholderiales bacterium]
MQRPKTLPHILLNTGKVSAMLNDALPHVAQMFETILLDTGLSHLNEESQEYELTGFPYKFEPFELPFKVLRVDFFSLKSDGARTTVASFYVIPTENAAEWFFKNVREKEEGFNYPTAPFCATLFKEDAGINEAFLIVCSAFLYCWYDLYVMPPIATPIELLERITVTYPKLNQYVGDMFIRKTDSAPPNIFLPMSAWETIAGKYDLTIKNEVAVNHLCSMSTAQTWAYSKGIYRFDPTLLEELNKTSLKGEIPIALLNRLPEFCVYVALPEGFCLPPYNRRLYGFFAILEFFNKERSFLTILPLFDTHRLPNRMLPYRMLLSGNAIEDTLKEVSAGMLEVAQSEEDVKVAVSQYEEELKFFINLVLYLCSDEPDIKGYIADTPPPHPAAKKTKQGFQLFPAAKATEYTVGEKIGTLIRTYKSEEDQKQTTQEGKNRSSPRPHIRTAHWTLYHVGVGRRDTRVRWIPPLVIGAGGKS